MGRPNAYPHQHLILRHPDRAGTHENGICGDATANGQPLPKLVLVVLHCHNERMDDRQGYCAMGQGLREA